MRVSIRALLFFTAAVALSANALLQWQRLARAEKDLLTIQLEIKRLNFDEAYVDSHTRACELAITNNPLPSPYYIAAKQRHDESIILKQQNAK
jgi:hypothetical protein